MQNGTNWAGYHYETHHLPQMWGEFYTLINPGAANRHGPAIYNWNRDFNNLTVPSGDNPGSALPKQNTIEFLKAYGVKPENIHIDDNRMEGYNSFYLYIDFPFSTQHLVHSGVSNSTLTAKTYKDAIDEEIRTVNMSGSVIFDVRPTWVESQTFTQSQRVARHSGQAFIHGRNVLRFDDTVFYVGDSNSVVITPTGNITESHLSIAEGTPSIYTPNMSGKFSIYMPSLYLKETVVSGTRYYYDYESIPSYINWAFSNNIQREQFVQAASGGANQSVYVKFKYDKMEKRTCKVAINHGTFAAVFPYYPTNVEDYAPGSTNNTVQETNRIKRMYTPPTGVYLEEFDLYGFPPSGEFNEMWVTIWMSGNQYTCYYRGMTPTNDDLFVHPTQVNTVVSGLYASSQVNPPFRLNHYSYYTTPEFMTPYMYDHYAELLPSGYERYKPKLVDLDFSAVTAGQSRQRLVNNPIDYFLPIRWWRGTKDIVLEKDDLPNGLSWRFSKPKFERNRIP